jgi:hypothetical protein
MDIRKRSVLELFWNFSKRIIETYQSFGIFRLRELQLWSLLCGGEKLRIFG